MTNYGKTRYYKVIDIEFEDIDSVMIPEENISIREYFKKRYELKIEQSRQPLLVVENKKKVYCLIFRLTIKLIWSLNFAWWLESPMISTSSEGKKYRKLP